jgi:RNA polymerase sigma factor (sigma-70 family)
MSIVSTELTQPQLTRKHQEENLDERLVRECLAGSQEAWSQLIDRYKNLIFSIPLKYGFSKADAGDIFQEVCVKLMSRLKNVKEPRALPKWLIQVTSHECFHWAHRQDRRDKSNSISEREPDFPVAPETLEIVHRAEQEQLLREAISRMPERCQQLVMMLFFEEPPRPYREVAADLGVAIGSIGLLRHRCIQRLRKTLCEIGVSSIDKL